MDWLWDFFFPPFCGGCDYIGTYLCKKCSSEFIFLPPHLESWWYTKSGCKVTARSLVAYTPPASTLLHKMKYGPVIAYAHVLSQLMWHYLPRPLNNGVCITSIPAHPSKQRQRGFDQAKVVALELARLWKVQYVPMLDRKESATSLVDQKSKKDRNAVAASVFLLHEGMKKKVDTSYSGQEIIVIDDVMTTGSTVRVCAELLSQLGAPKITILTFARKL